MYPQFWLDSEQALKDQVNRTGIQGEWKEKEEDDEKVLIFEVPPNPQNKYGASLVYYTDIQKIVFKGSPHFQNKFWHSSLKKLEFNPSAEPDPYESNLDNWELPDLIIPGLYLGSQYSAKNLSALKQRNITHVLVVGRDIPQYYPDNFEYKAIQIYDMEDEDLKQHFEPCIEFIIRGLENGAVLVHCQAGISRSSSVVIAYLMKVKKLSFDNAFDFVSKRRWVSPNMGFRKQLKYYQTEIESSKY